MEEKQTYRLQLAFQLPRQHILPKLDFVSKFCRSDLEGLWGYKYVLFAVWLSEEDERCG